MAFVRNAEGEIDADCSAHGGPGSLVDTMGIHTLPEASGSVAAHTSLFHADHDFGGRRLTPVNSTEACSGEALLGKVSASVRLPSILDLPLRRALATTLSKGTSSLTSEIYLTANTVWNSAFRTDSGVHRSTRPRDEAVHSRLYSAASMAIDVAKAADESWHAADCTILDAAPDWAGVGIPDGAVAGGRYSRAWGAGDGRDLDPAAGDGDDAVAQGSKSAVEAKAQKISV
ncbi:MAG: hypothetical protein MMC23_001450 [Stictis urceolatum]|nr:hypothetical protein [Stictis urceolata]